MASSWLMVSGCQRGAVRVPEAEAAEEGVLVRAQANVGRQLAELRRIAAAEDDVVRLHRRAEALDRLDDRRAPFLLAEPLPRVLADVVLERRLAERQVRELERLHDTVDDDRR